MGQNEKAKRSKASLYKLSDPHKFDDTEGEYWANQEPFEVENHRPRTSRASHTSRKEERRRP